MEFIKEYFDFLRSNPRWWLTPTIMILVLLAGLIFFAEGSVIAPFIYTLF